MNIKIKFHNPLYSILALLSLISLCGAAVYRVYALNAAGTTISLLSALILFFIIQRFQNEGKHNIWLSDNSLNRTINIGEKGRFKCLAVLYFILAAVCFFVLINHRTDQAIISPWQVVPPYYFACYAAATGIIFYLALKAQKARQEKNILFLLAVHYFLSFSAAWAIYKIGYGFDPFIHQATMDLIDKTGSVAPKPFYYLGQYSLLVITHKLTGISLVWLDKLLVPALAAVFLPLLMAKTFSKIFENSRIYLPLILAILALPFPYLIATMPQNLAYLFLLFSLLAGMACSDSYDLIMVFLFALASLLIQPVAGIPALLFACAMAVRRSDAKKIKKYLYGLIFIASSFALPFAFYLFEKASFGKGSLNKLHLSPPRITVPGQENVILNFTYLYGFNIKLAIGLLALAGLAVFWRHKNECKIFSIYLLMSLSLFASYFMSKILPFNFLIDYERDNYSERILLVAALFLLPFIISALYFLLSRIEPQPKKISLPIYIMIIFSTAASLYLSYPRFDLYFNSRGYSTGQSDIEAAEWINNDNNNDFIVLADQQVSAAALRQFGFKKYYKSKSDSSEIFYYPIPTGGPLYQCYLDMVYKKPDRATMDKAMDLAGVNNGYFVLNDYWRSFPKLIEEAKLEADSWKTIDNGKIFIFKYKK